MPSIEISNKLVLFLEFLPIFFLSLAVHEWAHAYTAFKKGDSTAKSLGRLTLNPIKHIDLIGSVLMPFLTYFTGSFFIGWAKPVPVNRSNLRNPRIDDILVSIAGPLSNLAMAILFTLLLYFSIHTFKVGENIINVLWLGVTFNVFLFLFNLIPIPPLDGSHIILNLFPNSFYAKMLVSPMIGTLLLFIFIFSPFWKYFISVVSYILRIFANIIR